jgi:hypothetical protein
LDSAVGSGTEEPIASLIEKLGEIPDPRRGNAQRRELLGILTIALVASVCGAESCVDFAEFAQDRETLLREFLSLKEGLPSHDTFSRVRRLLDPAGFARAFEAFPDDLGVDGDGVLAIAGQDAAPLLRPGGGTLGAARGHRLRHRRAGGDRPAVLREVAAFFADPPAPRAVFETTDADHGRIETRRHRITRSVDWLFSDRRHRRHRLRRGHPHRGRQGSPLDPLLPELGEACPRDLRPRCPRPPG